MTNAPPHVILSAPPHVILSVSEGSRLSSWFLGQNQILQRRALQDDKVGASIKGTDLFIDPQIAPTGTVDGQLVWSLSLRSRVNSVAKDWILGTKSRR